MSIYRYIGFFLFFSVFVFAESGWLGDMRSSTFILFILFSLSIPLLIILIFLYIFFNTGKLILYTIIGMILIYIGMFIDNYVAHHEPWPRHYYKEPYKYGDYKGSQIVNNTEEINVIYLANFPNLLDDNNTLYMPHSETDKKFHIKELENVKAFTENWEINVYDSRNTPKNVAVYKKYKINQTRYANDIYTNYIYDENLTYKHQKNLQNNILYFNDDQRTINDVNMSKTMDLRRPIVIIDRKNKTLQLYENRFYRAFKVPYTPKLTYYKEGVDRIYVVYEEVKGVYILENIHTKEYTHIQKIVSQTIDGVLHSWWSSPRYRDLPISKNEVKKLDKFLTNYSRSHFEYTIRVVKDTAIVNVIIDENKKLKFVLKKENDWTIKKIYYYEDYDALKSTESDNIDAKPYINIGDTTAYYFNELTNNLKNFISSDTKYRLFESWIKYKLTLQCIEEEAYSNTELNGAIPDYTKYALETLHSSQYSERNYTKKLSLLYQYDQDFHFDSIEKFIKLLTVPYCQDKTSVDHIYNLFMYRYLYHVGVQHLNKKELEKNYPSYYIQKQKESDISRAEKKRKHELEEKQKRIKWQKKHKQKTLLKFKEEFKKIEEEIENGMSQERKNKLLFSVARSGNYLVANLLIKNGADMYALDKYKHYTTFSYSLINRDWRYELAEVFIKHGVDVNYRYKMGETPLTNATKGCRSPKLVKLLLDHGADPYLMDEFKFNTVSGLFRYCKKNKNYNIIMEMMTQ